MAYGNGGTVSLGQYIPTQVDAPMQRQPMITAQMVTLEQRTEALSQFVAELEARIGAVLTPEPPSTNAKDPSPPHPSVALGAGLAQMNDRLGVIAQRVSQIIDRVEL